MTMSWQDRLRALGERLTSGEITTTEYRTQSEEILAEADQEAAAETQPRQGETAAPRTKVPIPKSAAWEAPSGEMTQIVGTDDHTRVVNNSITDKLTDPADPAD